MCRQSKPDDNSETLTTEEKRAVKAVTDGPGQRLDCMDEATRQFRYLMNDLFGRHVTLRDFRESAFVRVSELNDGTIIVEIPDLGVRLDNPLVKQVLWQLELLSTPPESRLFIEYNN